MERAALQRRVQIALDFQSQAEQVDPADTVPPRAELVVWTELDPSWSWARRIGGALRTFAPPWVRWCRSPAEADVRLLHIVGHTERRRALQKASPPFVAIQHVLSTASQELGGDAVEQSNGVWVELWRRALLTVSFHSLDGLSEQHGFRFLPLPWGADPRLFHPPAEPSAREAAVLCAGADVVTESFGELLWAASHSNVTVYHVGSGDDPLCAECLRNDGALHCQRQEGLGGFAPCHWWQHLGTVPDYRLRHLLRSVRFVSALRKEEGFELLGPESLLSGARPLVYDMPIYRRWYAGRAELVPLQATADALRRIFATVPPPPTPSELRVLRRGFGWRGIVGRLFKAVAAALDARRAP